MRTTTLVAALMLAGCGGTTQTTTEGTEEVSQAKVIPVTTKSPEALAAFERGRTLQENFRMKDAIVAYDEALALDPDFATAHAYRADGREGNDGLEELRKAAKLAATHPEAERLSIEAMVAMREGDLPKSKELWGQAVTLAPDDWRAHQQLGMYAFMDHDWNGAITSFVEHARLQPRRARRLGRLDRGPREVRRARAR
jgi:tetratricopeptide (TPR) repeat protein